MRNKVTSRGSVRGGKGVRKVLLVPAALAVTVLSAACGDDDPAPLASCAAVPNTGKCQVCLDDMGKKACAGASSCTYFQDRDVCEQIAA